MLGSIASGTVLVKYVCIGVAVWNAGNLGASLINCEYISKVFT